MERNEEDMAYRHSAKSILIDSLQSVEKLMPDRWCSLVM